MKIDIQTTAAQPMTADQINNLAEFILSRKVNVDFAGTNVTVTPGTGFNPFMAGIIVKASNGKVAISGATEITDEEWNEIKAYGVPLWMVEAANTYNISVSAIVQAYILNTNAQKRCIYITSEKWGNSETTSPDTTNYYGLYESKTRGATSVSDILTVHTCGKAGTLKVLVTSWAEGGHDYCIVGNLDASVDSGTKIDTKSNNKDSTSVSNFLVAEFDIPDANDHYFQIKYRTDLSINKNDDRAYLLIPKTEGIVVTNFTS